MKKLFVVLLCMIPLSIAYAGSWSFGLVDITESYSNKVLVRWNGPNTENCGSSNVVIFNIDSLGSQEAVNRAFSIALAVTASQKPIRFHLEGCIGATQKATAVQMCSKQDCSYQ